MPSNVCNGMLTYLWKALVPSISAISSGIFLLWSWVFSWGVIPNKGVTWLTSASPAEVPSVIGSGLSVGIKVSLHSGLCIDEGASREELASMTSICLGWASSRYSSFGGGTDNGSCWSCACLSFCVLGMGVWKCPHSWAAQYSPIVIFQMQNVCTKMPVKIWSWSNFHEISTKCTLNGTTNSTKHANVKQYVTMDSCVATNARPVVLPLQSGAIFTTKVRWEECDCTHPVHWG